MIPEFGVADPGATYDLRPGGYVVVVNRSGEVAVVKTPAGFALPGGGQEGSETPEAAAVREALEECGLIVALKSSLGVADELIFAADERTHYRKRCSFFLASVVGTAAAGEADHELHWLPARDAADALLHESQRWAVEEASRLLNGGSA